jgi:nucleoside-diphosphate-sugar epimerase
MSCYLIYGGEGWIGGQLAETLRAQGKVVHIGKTRFEFRTELQREILAIKPDFILNCAGKTGRPNVDWCEDHRAETIRSNVVGTLTLFDVAQECGGIHVTNYATGCIYSYDAAHPIDSGRGFTEEDEPNFSGSHYSLTKGMVDRLLRTGAYPNVLTLRLRMPISDDLHPRSFITKITHYAKVVNIPNSVAVLHDLLPISLDMTERRLKGVYNFTNPGAASHNQILTLYKQIVDPAFTWTNFSDQEQMVVKAPRSNNELDVSKLLALYPNIPHIRDSLPLLFARLKANLAASAAAPK